MTANVSARPRHADGSPLLTGNEILRVKPLFMAMANCEGTRHLVKTALEGETIYGNAAVYHDHELLRSLYFANMVAKAHGRHVEVNAK